MLKIITKCKKGSCEFKALDWFLNNFLNIGNVQKNLHMISELSRHRCHAEINVCLS